MKEQPISRRTFIRSSSLAAAGAVAGGLSPRTGAQEKTPDAPKILNYNPQMHYRRLGKSGLLLSEVSLGGHWKNREGGSSWDVFAHDEVPADVVGNRTDVVGAAIDRGLNYLDVTTAAECLSYGAALRGRREKMFLGADLTTLGPRDSARCNVKDQTRNVEECLRLLKTDYLDIWRPQAKTDGSNTDAEVQVLIETFDKLQKEGKVRHLGVSSHSRPWLEHVLQTFPAFEMVLFPCSAKTREKDAQPAPGNVEEVNPGHGADQTQSIFKTVLEKDVGVVTIKPFFGGSLFPSCGKDTFPVAGTGAKTENDLARLTLQCILSNKAITATVPGLSTVYEVENAAVASYTRRLGLAPAQKRWLAQHTEARWAALPAEYAWLRDWERV
jgi:predicted aldo/keto reductase-like oxidoreductase